MTTATEQVYSLRLPRDLYDQAKARAAAEERSLNSLIRVALRAYLEAAAG